MGRHALVRVKPDRPGRESRPLHGRSAERRWVRWGNAGPAGRVGQGVAYDPLRRRIVLYGGAADGGQAFFTDIWEFDGTSWQRLR